MRLRLKWDYVRSAPELFRSNKEKHLLDPEGGFEPPALTFMSLMPNAEC